MKSNLKSNRNDLTKPIEKNVHLFDNSTNQHQSNSVTSVDSNQEDDLENLTNSLSTFSTILDPHDHLQKLGFASPNDHLAKLKRIHQIARRRNRWKQFKQIFGFVSLRCILILILLGSIVCILCSYLLNLRILLISGILTCLSTIGCLIQLCFTARSLPNKFNPMSIPFALDIKDMNNLDQTESISVNSNKDTKNQPNCLNSNRASTQLDQIQVRRLSMALNRLVQNRCQTMPYVENESMGFLKIARRLTMASLPMGMMEPRCEYLWTNKNYHKRGLMPNTATWNQPGSR